jgi:hypothetical protein
MIAQVFGSMADEKIKDPLGHFGDVRIPVQRTGTPAYWSTNETEYVLPQTEQEHEDTLNRYYAMRQTMPNWRELGMLDEQQLPHINSKDSKLRKDLGARSSFVTDIVYNPSDNVAMIQLNGGKYYTYSCTPQQMQRFLSAGSLGQEINRIKRNRGTSMNKTATRRQPNVRSSLMSNIFGGL